MFDFLTGAVLLLSAVYEGYRLYHAVNALAALNSAAAGLDTDTAAFIQTEAMKNDTIVEIVCCSALLLLTLICLIRFIRWAIIGNIIFLTHNTTKGFLKTTNKWRRERDEYEALLDEYDATIVELEAKLAETESPEYRQRLNNVSNYRDQLAALSY